jgi:hypothetical protein
MLRAVEAEENALQEVMTCHVTPKLFRARLYRMAITDRWVKLADEKRDPAANRFKGVLELAHEIAAGQEWLRDQMSEEPDKKPEDAAG